MDDSEPSPLVRAHRAKRARESRVWAVDWGAVAAGLCVGVVTLFGAIAGVLPRAVGVALVAAGLFVGAVIAGRLADTKALCSASHGFALALSLTLLMAVVATSATLAGESPVRVPLVTLASNGWLALATALVGSLAIGAAGGLLGASLGDDR